MNLFNSYKKLPKPFGKVFLYLGFILPLVASYLLKITLWKTELGDKEDMWGKFIFTYIALITVYFIVAKIIMNSFFKKQGK